MEQKYQRTWPVSVNTTELFTTSTTPPVCLANSSRVDSPLTTSTAHDSGSRRAACFKPLIARDIDTDSGFHSFGSVEQQSLRSDMSSMNHPVSPTSQSIGSYKSSLSSSSSSYSLPLRPSSSASHQSQQPMLLTNAEPGSSWSALRIHDQYTKYSGGSHKRCCESASNSCTCSCQPKVCGVKPATTNSISELPSGSNHKSALKPSQSSPLSASTPAANVADGSTARPRSKSEKDQSKSSDSRAKDAESLAAKIEFCMKFGYTTQQIRMALKKLTTKATKNDILSELFKYSSQKQAAPNVSADGHTSPSSKAEISKSVSFEQDFALKRNFSEPLSSSQQHTELRARGPDSPALTTSQVRSGKEVRNSNSLNKENNDDDSCNLRPIVIDGSNVAMSHGKKKVFSCKGILLAVNYFRARNHQDITVFVPNYRKELSRPDALIEDREILDKLEQERILVYTPSRCINGKRVTCYDDRFILRLAQDTDGIIVSNDHFRDLQNEKPEWKELIEKRLLMYSYVNDLFMPPDDPLGRNGPGLNNFLRKRPAAEEQSRPQCPYGRKCTFGKKCKYFHPEASASYKSVTDRLKEKSERNKEPSNMAKSLANEICSSTPLTANTVATNSRGSFQNEEQQRQHEQHELKSSTTTSHHHEADQQQAHNKSGYFQLSHQQSGTSLGAMSDGGSYHHHHHQHQQQQCTSPTPTSHHIDKLSEQACNHLNISSSTSGRATPPSSSSSSAASNFEQQQQQQRHHSFPAAGDTTQRMHHSYPGHPGATSGGSSGAQRLSSMERECHSDGVRHMGGGQQQLQQQQHITLQYPPSQLAFSPMQQSTHPYGMGVIGVPHMYHHQSFAYAGHQLPLGHHPHHASIMYSPAASYPASTGYNPQQVQQQRQQPTQPSTHPSPMYMAPPHHSYPFIPNPRLHPQQQTAVAQQQQQSSSSAGQQSQRSGGSSAGSSKGQQHSLSNPQNPRYNLYKNLCGLFPRQVVEEVMNSNPGTDEPKKLIKLCLGES